MITDHVKEKYEPYWAPSNCCNHCGECDDPESTRQWPEDSDGDRICPDCLENEGFATGPIFVFAVCKRVPPCTLAPATRYLCFRGQSFDLALEVALAVAKRQDVEAIIGSMRFAVYPHGILNDEVWMWKRMMEEKT